MYGPRSGSSARPSTTRPKHRASIVRTGARKARYRKGTAGEGHTAGGLAVAAVGRAIGGLIARSPGAREAVASDGRIVLGDGHGEVVAMIVAGDEVEVLHGRRRGGGLDGGEPGACDRPRRQAGMHVRVVGMIGREVGA